MCLYLNRLSRPKKARKDIVCYKLLSRNNFLYYSPAMDIPICEQIIKGEIPYKAQEGSIKNYIKKSPNKYLAKGILEEGVIHSYADKQNMDFLFDCDSFLCVIPKGTEYIKGINILGESCYGSKEIKFIRKIE